MFKVLFKILSGVTVLVILYGCAGTGKRLIWKSDPSIHKISNECFDIEAKTYCYNGNPAYIRGCRFFDLLIKNKTDKNIEINWNKTFFIDEGQTNGGFMFEGIVFKDRNNQKPPNIIFGKGKFQKSIYPNVLVYYEPGQFLGWHHEKMQPGEKGIFLTLSIADQEISEKIILNISSEPEK